MGRRRKVGVAVAVAAAGALAASALVAVTSGLPSAVAARSAFSADSQGSRSGQPINALVAQGKQTFRFDTFGDQAFWGDTLHLNQAIAGAANGGVGPGVSPKTALSVGLKVDVDALPGPVRSAIADGQVDLDDPAVTLTLLKLNSVVGVKGIFDRNGRLNSVGIECALCHSTVDNSLAPGIGHRLDGWANRDLNVGAIIGLSPNLQPVASLLHTDVATVHRVLDAWGPGKFDAELFLDGKAFQPNGTLGGDADPAGVRAGRGQPAHLDRLGLHPVLERVRRGAGDARPGHLLRPAAGQRGTSSRSRPRTASGTSSRRWTWSPRSCRRCRHTSSRWEHRSHRRDRSTRWRPPAARRCSTAGPSARPATCRRRSPSRAENLHPGSQIGIDSFEADRSPTHMYRTSPLGGLWSHQKGGFYHDGRFPDLLSVVKHYDSTFHLGLSGRQQNDLVQYLLSL